MSHTELTLNEYSLLAKGTAVFPEAHGEQYLTLGLTSEVGELTGKIAKYYRKDQEGDFPLSAVLDELGDVLWFVALLADFYGSDLATVAKTNINKLADRKARGVLKGSGDNR